jgi:hypothetical protein
MYSQTESIVQDVSPEALSRRGLLYNGPERHGLMAYNLLYVSSA